MPIARLIITEAAIRIGKAFARVAAVMFGAFPLSRQPDRIEFPVNLQAPEAALQFRQSISVRPAAPVFSVALRLALLDHRVSVSGLRRVALLVLNKTETTCIGSSALRS